MTTPKGKFSRPCLMAMFAAVAALIAGAVAAQTPINDARQQWQQLNAQVMEAYRAGGYAKGVAAAEQATQLARQAFGPRHPDTLTSLSNLAELYRVQGRHGEAEPLFKEPLQTSSRFPTLTGRVVDEARIVTDADKEAINGLIDDHEERTTNQIVVVTVNSLRGMPIEDFSRELGNYWHIGQRGKDNGILLVVSPTERKVRIEVGSGLTHLLTDAKSRRIIDEVLVPDFQSGWLSAGIRNGVKSIIAALDGCQQQWQQLNAQVATGSGSRAQECFCLANEATGAMMRGCEAYKAPTHYYATAVCTDPETGRKSEQTMSSDWQRIEEGADRCTPCRRASQKVEPEVPRGSPLVTASRTVTASRIFAGPNQYPPTEFAAYGILAFRSQPSTYDRDRHSMFCHAYVATLPHESELEVPRSKQMVTVWPVNSEEYTKRLNKLVHRSIGICEIAVDNYGLVIALQSLKDAELTGENLTRTGPFLLAWSPATDKGKQDALVLVSDLSDVTTYEQARERLEAWSREIERDPTLWIEGWNRERLRIAIRNWVDKYGTRSLAVSGLKG